MAAFIPTNIKQLLFCIWASTTLLALACTAASIAPQMEARTAASGVSSAALVAEADVAVGLSAAVVQAAEDIQPAETPAPSWEQLPGADYVGATGSLPLIRHQKKSGVHEKAQRVDPVSLKQALEQQRQVMLQRKLQQAPRQFLEAAAGTKHSSHGPMHARRLLTDDISKLQTVPVSFSASVRVTPVLSATDSRLTPLQSELKTAVNGTAALVTVTGYRPRARITVAPGGFISDCLDSSQSLMKQRLASVLGLLESDVSTLCTVQTSVGTGPDGAADSCPTKNALLLLDSTFRLNTDANSTAFMYRLYGLMSNTSVMTSQFNGTCLPSPNYMSVTTSIDVFLMMPDPTQLYHTDNTETDPQAYARATLTSNIVTTIASSLGISTARIQMAAGSLIMLLPPSPPPAPPPSPPSPPSDTIVVDDSKKKHVNEWLIPVIIGTVAIGGAALVLCCWALLKRYRKEKKKDKNNLGFAEESGKAGAPKPIKTGAPGLDAKSKDALLTPMGASATSGSSTPKSNKLQQLVKDNRAALMAMSAVMSPKGRMSQNGRQSMNGSRGAIMPEDASPMARQMAEDEQGDKPRPPRSQRSSLPTDDDQSPDTSGMPRAHSRRAWGSIVGLPPVRGPSQGGDAPDDDEPDSPDLEVGATGPAAMVAMLANALRADPPVRRSMSGAGAKLTNSPSRRTAPALPAEEDVELAVQPTGHSILQVQQAVLDTRRRTLSGQFNPAVDVSGGSASRPQSPMVPQPPASNRPLSATRSGAHSGSRPQSARERAEDSAPADNQYAGTSDVPPARAYSRTSDVPGLNTRTSGIPSGSHLGEAPLTFVPTFALQSDPPATEQGAQNLDTPAGEASPGPDMQPLAAAAGAEAKPSSFSRPSHSFLPRNFMPDSPMDSPRMSASNLGPLHGEDSHGSGVGWEHAALAANSILAAGSSSRLAQRLLNPSHTMAPRPSASMACPPPATTVDAPVDTPARRTFAVTSPGFQTTSPQPVATAAATAFEAANTADPAAASLSSGNLPIGGSESPNSSASSLPQVVAPPRRLTINGARHAQKAATSISADNSPAAASAGPGSLFGASARLSPNGSSSPVGGSSALAASSNSRLFSKRLASSRLLSVADRLVSPSSFNPNEHHRASAPGNQLLLPGENVPGAGLMAGSPLGANQQGSSGSAVSFARSLLSRDLAAGSSSGAGSIIQKHRQTMSGAM